MTKWGSYIPHGVCVNWDPALLAAEISNDALTALAYFIISGLLFGMALFHAEPISPLFNRIIVCFSLFIFLCGLGHAVDILMVWHSAYYLKVAVGGARSLVSMATAVLCIWYIVSIHRVLIGAAKEIERRNAS